MGPRIKHILINFAYRLLRYSGLPYIFRELIQKNKVTILFFHDPDVKAAEQAFAYLSEKYNFISLAQFLDAYMNKDGEQIPEKAMIITFDDGFMPNYNLLPVFKKYNVPATIFLCAGITDTKRHHWFEENNSPIPFKRLIKMSDSERQEILEESGFSREKEFENPRALTLSQINEMKEIVDFQSHTNFHPILPTCTDEGAWNEIAGSKKTLETKFGLKINAIAYPNGDYSERDIQIARDAGYKCGLTVDYGFNDTTTDLFRLKRLCVNDTNNLDELIVKATGAWDFFKIGNRSKQSGNHIKIKQQSSIIEAQKYAG